MVEWAILPFKRYADFQGRSRRLEFWSFALLNVAVYVVIAGILFGTGFSFVALDRANAGNPLALVPMFFGGFGLLMLAWWLATLIPNVAVTVRRLHDRDLSGWWYLAALVASMIPRVGFVASLALLVVLLLPGARGSNRFGLDPKDPAGVEIFV